MADMLHNVAVTVLVALSTHRAHQVTARSRLVDPLDRPVKPITSLWHSGRWW